MHAHLTRRDFLRTTLAVAAGAHVRRHGPRRLAAGGWERHAPSGLRLVLVEPASGASISVRERTNGVLLGADEARRGAALFGGDVRLERARARVGEPLADAARRLLGPAAGGAACTVLLGGEGAEECGALAGLAMEGGVIYVNTLCAADALRAATRERCQRLVFHVAPSDAMLRDALNAWLAAGGDTSRTAPEARTPDRARPPSIARWAAVWDGTLERFGADQLNDRYRLRFREPMTPAAWAGWAAVKGLWEGVLRARATEPAAVAAYLAGDAFQFDGHKGRPLSFRSWDHQLRQPIYILTASSTGTPRVAAELPAAPPGVQESSRATLDRIGVAAADTLPAPACRSGG